MSTRAAGWTPRILLVGLVLGAVPSAVAQGVHVEDPRGDVRLSGAPVAAGLEWADLLQGGFRQEDGQLLAWLRVAGNEPPRGSGEFGLVFSVSNRSFMIGYTVVPPYYQGPFFCRFAGPADLQGDYFCEAGNGTLVAGNLTVTVDAGKVGLNLTPLLHSPWAWSETNYNKPGERLRLDTTAVGRGFPWSLPDSDETFDPTPSRSPDAGAVPAPSLLAVIASIFILLGRRLSVRP